jgi:hypothetical protein
MAARASTELDVQFQAMSFRGKLYASCAGFSAASASGSTADRSTVQARQHTTQLPIHAAIFFFF